MLENIDEAIQQVERLYRSVTGKDVPGGDAPYAPIPPEKDASRYVEDQLMRLHALLGERTVAQPYAPPVAVWEGPSEVLLCVDLPGVPRDAVEVTTTGQALVVAGHRPERTGEAGLLLRGAERPGGTFRRVLPLPPGTNPEQVQAQLRDGVLELRVPRTAAQPRTVHVQ